MRPLTTIILLVLSTAALALVALVEREQPSTAEAAEKSRLVADWPAESISRIEITNAAGRIVLAQSDGGWEVREPFVDRADPAEVREILKLAGETPVLERIPADEVRRKSELKSFGLDPGAAVQVVFRDAAGRELSLLIGEASAYEESAYVRESGDPGRADVLVARTSARTLVAQAASEFRDPKVVGMEPGSLQRLRVEPAEGRPVVLVAAPLGEEARARGERPLWSIVEPVQERADQEVIDRLLAGLFGARAESFLEDLPAQSGSPVARITLTSDAGDETLDIHRSAADPEDSLVRSSRRGAVARAGSDLLALQLCTLDRLRDMTLADLDARRLRTFIVEGPQGRIELRQIRNRWMLRQDSSWAEANRDRVEETVKLLNEAHVLEADDAPADLERYGLEAPFLTLTFGSGENASESDLAPLTEKNSARLRLGERQNRFYAQWSAQPAVYRFDGSILEGVRRHPVSYKGRRVLSFPPLSLRKLTINRLPSPPLELTHQLDGARWSARRQDTDLSAHIDHPQLERYVNHLSEITAHDWVVDPEAAREALEHPSLVIEIVVEHFGEEADPGLQVARLKFAPLVAGQTTALYYGQLNDQPEIFLIRRDQFDQLSSSVLLRDPENSSAHR